MASTTPRKLLAMFTFICIALLLSSSWVQFAEANVCQRPSKTWSGPCLNTKGCKDQCIRLESAIFGACHSLTCYCYFNCT
ncbi:hypothetical protein PIB30_025996 [Stylosanthes scabra]|uniref:Knottins-like domain-containing protein n=1 Tax=Stylosanthes scabra TaxID=79078 RepID=A0ABU6UCY6_9FABA|nr:hypothetical protein [Stylosanthes scabra]